MLSRTERPANGSSSKRPGFYVATKSPIISSRICNPGTRSPERGRIQSSSRDLTSRFPTLFTYACLRKGELKHISVILKTRQGRRAVTCVTGFENFQVEADDFAEELRKACASSTSVNPLPGKAAGQEIMIQGKQLKAVTDLLIAKGVPKQWIEIKDTTGKK